MRSHKDIQMPPEEWRQYCLMKRRMEWLEIRHSRFYREHPWWLHEVNTRYADVSMGVQEFGELLGNCKNKSGVKIPAAGK